MNVLVLAPHPDDEAIGVGGTIRKHVKLGDSVFTIFLTSGEKGAGEDSPENLGHVRVTEARNAAEILGHAKVAFLGQPDGALDSNAASVRDTLRKAIETVKPDRIYAPHSGESHPDHQATAWLASDSAIVGEVPVFFYEVWTPLSGFNIAIDISEEIEDKMAAIRAHKTQCERMAFDMAALGLARYRGVLHNRPNGPYAEVFQRLQ